MELLGYTYITHKVVPRPSGNECRFTAVRDSDGFEVSDTVFVGTSTDIQSIIQSFLDRQQSTIIEQEVTVPVDDRIAVSMAEAQSKVKLTGCAFLKSAPSCSFEEFINYLNSVLAPEDAMLAPKLFTLYRDSAFSAGRITENIFEAFRDFVVATPTDVLMRF